MSFSRGQGREPSTGTYNTSNQTALADPPVRAEPITLATLDRDCFIIPVASLDRFLPAGVPVSLKGFFHVQESAVALAEAPTVTIEPCKQKNPLRNLIWENCRSDGGALI